MKRFLTLFLFLAMCYFGLAGCTGGGSGGDSGTTLQTEPVETPPDGGDGEVPVHNLFASEPGTMVSMSALTGTVDPVGTNIVDDFDGDGLVNSKETTGNVWVADYPHIGASISTPVTMRIEILYNSETSSKELSSEIMAEDTENTKVNSSDVVHRKEVNNRTVQFQDRILTTSSQNLNIGARRIDGFKKGRIAANIKTAGIGSVRTKGTTSLSNSYTDTTDRTFTDWADKPFKNDVDAEGWAQKDNSKSKRAKQLRTEYRSVSDTTKKIKPNSGYVRASLYITNNTVNMPVKLSNILCSFMLENSDGKLLPVQSFRLRNDDYSLFELNLYGDKTFGPYVIELANLNTQEIKDAIAKGYNPRIFLVDYQMEHVPDSNYRTALSGSFSGNNLKIVEENAKGRTAGIKLVYPGDRQFFRVTAFDTDGVESRTGSVGATTFSPGVSLEKALNRITYSGVDIQYADIVFDMSGMDPEFSIPRFHIRTIKSINGEEMNLPFPIVDSVPYKTITGNHVDKDGISLGGSSTAYLTKPIGEWTDQEIQDFEVWAVFENGRYYLHTGDVLSTGDVPTYFEYQILGQAAVRVPMVRGIQSMIWPGDHYDIVCLEFEEQEEELPAAPTEEKPFGTNPFETGSTFTFNTKWNLDSIEEYPFQPDAGSVFLGEAILGDTIEFTIKLNQTRYLNPDFGIPDTTTEPGKRIYKAFSYDLDRPVVTRKFDLDEAVDFEISFGLGGQYKHWTNLVDPINRSPSSIYNLDVSDRNWNYLDQEFTIRIPIPMDLDGVGPDGSVKVFIRPARNNAYRESVWPLPHAEVKQFRGTLLAAADTGATQIEFTDTVGTAYVNDTLYLDGYGYQISAVDIQTEKTVVTLATALLSDNEVGEKVYVNLHNPPTEPEIQIELPDTFESDWNLANQDSTTDNGDAYKPLAVVDQDPDTPANYLGYYNNMVETNWIGAQTYANSYWNQWADSTKTNDLLQKNSNNSQLSNSKNLFNFRNYKKGSPIMLDNSIGDGFASPQMLALDDKILSVWLSNDGAAWSIKGRFSSTSEGIEGSFITNEFQVNTTSTEIGGLRIKRYDNDTKAIIAWNTVNGIKAQIINLESGSEGSKIGTEISISTESKLDLYDNLVTGLNLIVCNEKLLVVWERILSASNRDLIGQFVDLSPLNLGSLINTSFQIPQHINGSEWGARTLALENKILIAWASQGTTTSYADVRARFIDVSDGNLGNWLTSELYINTYNHEHEFFQEIIPHDEKVLFYWTSRRPSNFIINGQLLSTKSADLGAKIGSEFQINTSANHYRYPTIGAIKQQNKVLLTWISGPAETNQWRIVGKFFDFDTGAVIGNEILLTEMFDFSYFPRLATHNNKSYLVWYSKTDDETITVKTKIIEADFLTNTVYQGLEFDLFSECEKLNIHNPPISNAKNAYVPCSKKSNLTNSKLFFSVLNWRINERNLFKAPLLERDYEVKARIVEELQ